MKLVRILAAVTLVAAGGLFRAPAAVAYQEQVKQQQQQGGKQAQELAPVMLVLDASGSMKADDPSGRTKMQAAKAAVRLLMEEIPANAQLGLTVYGTGTGNSEAEKAAGCQDVKVLHEVGALDRQSIIRSAEAIQPSGYTPVGKSLQVAADALPQEGPRSIVLVSDGIDTCAPPDPCQIAKQLAQQGVDLSVHTVGFDVDAKAKQQLTCIAESTGGTYTDAADAEELGSALTTVTDTALRSYQAVGTPVQGGTDQASAPTLQPGAYLDHLDPKEVLYYTVNIKPGYTLYTTATVVYPRGQRGSEILTTKLYAADGSECTGYNGEVRDTSVPMVSAVGTYTIAPDATAKEEETCERPGRYTLRVTRDSVAEGIGTVDLELLIGLEPPLAGTPSPPPTDDDTVTFTQPSGQPTPVVGGGSFSTAATLPGSGVYTDTIQHGEFVFYRVRLDWGQGFAYQIHLPDRSSDVSNLVYTSMYDFQRKEQGWGGGVYDDTATKYPEGETAFATIPVRYANRAADLEATSVAGWYYISLHNLKSSADDEGEPVKVTIDLSVVGKPKPGPQYAGAASGGEGKGDPFGGVSLGTEEPKPESTPDAKAAGGDGGTGGTGPLELVSQGGPLLWGALAAVVLLVVALALTVRVNRQRR